MHASKTLQNTRFINPLIHPFHHSFIRYPNETYTEVIQTTPRRRVLSRTLRFYDAINTLLRVLLNPCNLKNYLNRNYILVSSSNSFGSISARIT